jgi:cytidine deaminase
MEDELIRAAAEAREHAYAPYSGYRVGAALLDERGRTHIGCNMENISYGLTVCAERSAISAMVASGVRKVKRIAVVTKDGGTPCGMCLQTLAEFCEDPTRLEIVCAATNGRASTFVLAELLPKSFQSEAVARTSNEFGGSTST